MRTTFVQPAPGKGARALTSTDGGAHAPLPVSIAILRAQAKSGGAQPEATCRLLSEATRSIGAAGDALTVAVDRAEWDQFLGVLQEGAGGWFEVELGDTAQSVTLGGYSVRAVRSAEYGVTDASGIVRATAVYVDLVTTPGTWRDGRGGMLRARPAQGDGPVWNPLGPDGLPDAEHPAYRTNRQLMDLCGAALLGLLYDGNTPVEFDQVAPPGPVDYANARPLPELEALLARVGGAFCLRNDGLRFRLVRLSRGGTTFTLPPEYTDLAEPFELTSGPSVLATTIAVTSGETRATVVTSRDLSGARALEWVWFDERTGAWLNDAETAGLYPGETTPGDIDAFRAGPPASAEPGERAEYERLFRAVRLHEDDRPVRLATFAREVVVQLPGAGAQALALGGGSCACVARHAERGPKSQWANVAAAGEPAVAARVRAHAEDGVFEFSAPMVAMPAPGNGGAYSDAVALAGSDLTVVYAHESETGVYRHDFFVRVFRANDQGAVSEVTDDAEVEAALVAPTTVVAHAPYLARLFLRPGWTPGTPGVLGVAENDAALTAFALTIAKARADAELVESGVIPIRGLHAIEPGDWGGAVTSVTWDIPGHTTWVSVNEHAEPDSLHDALAAEANRSLAAGLSRFTLPGSSGGRSDVRAGTGPTTGEISGAAMEHGKAMRGASATSPARLVNAAAESVAPRGDSEDSRPGSLLARITAATSVGPNRWEYGWQEAKFADGAVGVVSGGRTSANNGTAFNLAELANDGAGVEGNGVDRAHLPAGWAMQPIRERFVVLDGPFRDASGPVWFFSATNADDGECASASETDAGGEQSGEEAMPGTWSDAELVAAGVGSGGCA